MNFRNLLIFLALCSLLHILWHDLFTCAVFNTFCDLTYLPVQPFIFLRCDLFTYVLWWDLFTCAANYKFWDLTFLTRSVLTCLSVQPFTCSVIFTLLPIQPFTICATWPIYLCSLLYVLQLDLLLQALCLDLFTCAAFYTFCDFTSPFCCVFCGVFRWFISACILAIISCILLNCKNKNHINQYEICRRSLLVIVSKVFPPFYGWTTAETA